MLGAGTWRRPGLALVFVVLALAVVVSSVELEPVVQLEAADPPLSERGLGRSVGDQSEELGESAAVRRGASVRLFNGFMNPSAGGSEVKVSERLGDAAPHGVLHEAIKGLEQRLIKSGMDPKMVRAHVDSVTRQATRFRQQHNPMQQIQGLEKKAPKLLKEANEHAARKSLRQLHREHDAAEYHRLQQQAHLMAESAGMQRQYKRIEEHKQIAAEMSDGEAIEGLKALQADNNGLAHVSKQAKQADRLEQKMKRIERRHPGALAAEEMRKAKEAGLRAAKEVAKKSADKQGDVGKAEEKKENADWWKSCTDYDGDDGLGTSTYDMKITTEVRAAGEIDGKNRDITAVLGAKRKRRSRVKTSGRVQFRIHDVSLGCMKETMELLGANNWEEKDEQHELQPPVTAKVQGRDRFVGYKPVRLRAVTIHGFEASQYGFGAWKKPHNSETPMTKDMQDQLLNKLKCGFAFTQSKAGHVLKFFHEANASPACIRIKASIAEYFESYYFPNGKKQYVVKNNGDNHEDLAIKTDHYYDGKLASVCRKTTGNTREFYQRGAQKDNRINLGRGVTRCCSHYSMTGHIERSDCKFRLREAESGAGASKLTGGRRRRTMELKGIESEKERQAQSSKLKTMKPKPKKVKKLSKKEQAKQKRRALYKAPKMLGGFAGARDTAVEALLQMPDKDDGHIEKFNWKDVWSQKSWTAGSNDAKEKTVGLESELGGPFLGEAKKGKKLSSAEKFRKSRKKKTENDNGGGAARPVMTGTVRVKMELISREPNSAQHGTPTVAPDLKANGFKNHSDVLLQLSSKWAQEVHTSDPYDNHHEGASDWDKVDDSRFQELMATVLLDVSSADTKADEFGDMMNIFQQDPSYAMSAADQLLKHGGSDKAKSIISGAIGAAGKSETAQRALVKLLESKATQAHAATASLQVVNPHGDLIQKLDQCSRGSEGKALSDHNCACLLSLNHLANHLQSRQRHAEATQIVENTWNLLQHHSDSCVLAALANAGPAATHKADEMMRMAVSHPDQESRSMLIDALRGSQHPEVDNFLQKQIGDDAPLQTQSAAAETLAMRKSGAATERAIHAVSDKVKSGLIQGAGLKSQLHHCFSRRTDAFHSPAAEDLLKQLKLTLLIQEEAMPLDVEQALGESGIKVEPSFRPSALEQDQLEAKMLEVEASSRIDAKQRAKDEKEITNKIRPKITRQMKRKVVKEVVEETRKRLLPDVMIKLKAKLAEEMKHLRTTLVNGGYDTMEKKKLENALRSRLKDKFMKGLDRKVRTETKEDIRKRVALEVPGKVKKAVEKALTKRLKGQVKQAKKDMLAGEESTEDKPASSPPALRYSSMKTCKNYDKTKKFSCERGARKCMRTKGSRLGCVGASAFTTADWKFQNGIEVHANGGYLAELYGWRRQLMSAGTTGLFNGKTGPDSSFVMKSFIKVYDFNTNSDVYAHKATGSHTNNGEGDSCRGFQKPATLLHKSFQTNMFSDKRCFGLPKLASLCGKASLTADVASDFGLNLVTPGYDAVVAYVKPTTTLDLHTSMEGDNYAFATYARSKTTLIQGQVPVSSVFAFTKFKGGYESRWAVTALASSLATGVKGPGKVKEETPNDKVNDFVKASQAKKKNIAMMKKTKKNKPPGPADITIVTKMKPATQAKLHAAVKTEKKRAEAEKRNPGSAKKKAPESAATAHVRSVLKEQFKKKLMAALTKKMKPKAPVKGETSFLETSEGGPQKTPQLENTQMETNAAFNDAFDKIAKPKAGFEKSFASVLSVCLACTDWEGPNDVYTTTGIDSVSVLGARKIPGNCGPVGRGMPVPMPTLKKSSSATEEIVNKEEEAGVNPALALRPKKAKKRLLNRQRRERRAARVLIASRAAYKSAQTRGAQSHKKFAEAEKYMMSSIEMRDHVMLKSRRITAQYRKDVRNGMGFMSKQKFDFIMMKKNAAQYALKMAKRSLASAKSQDTVKQSYVKERQHKMERANTKAKAAAGQVKIANLQVVLAKEAEAAAEGQNSKAMQLEVQEARRQADKARAAQLANADVIHRNMNRANVLIAERRHKVRRAKRLMEEAQGERSKAENLLVKEVEVKGDKRVAKANEMRTMGKDLVRNFMQKKEAEASQEKKFQQVLARRRFTNVKVSARALSSRGKRRMERQLRRAKRRAARRITRKVHFAHWMLEAKMNAKERNNKFELAKESVTDSLAVKTATNRETQRALSAVTIVNSKIEQTQDNLAVARTKARRVSLKVVIAKAQDMKETRSYTLKRARTRLQYATVMVKEREVKLKDAKDEKTEADQVLQARVQVLRTQKREGSFHSNAKALRKQLRKLNSRRRSVPPGSGSRRRFKPREPRTAKTHGGERRRRTSVMGWKNKAPHKAVPMAVLNAMKLKSQNEPRKLIRKELKALGARRRRTKENDLAIQKSSSAVWTALESQIRRASSKEASKAAQKAAKRGQQAFDDLSKAIGAPLVKQKKHDDAKEKAWTKGYKSNEAKRGGLKHSRDRKALQKQLSATNDPAKRKSLKKSLAAEQADAEKKAAETQETREPATPEQTKERLHQASQKRVEKQLSKNAEYRLAKKLHKKSVQVAKEKYKLTADKPKKHVKKEKSLPADVVTAEAEITDMRKNLAAEKTRWKKLKNAAKDIDPETKKRKKVEAATPRL